ncbi:hypothetical protein [Zhongshania aliphaticivorans]|uniref:hypothetical protein n=1 Tax=Zhongshania aliphaticivorans TaxID=1470434 RepID=UPI0012E64EBC|nr:hypothetical protein [Zhongshania aliphaticivorans]CAA0083640.1 Uncharacterised protein [Zhongshania aliphaticivorans]
MKIYNKVACSLIFSFMAAVANAQMMVVSELLAVTTPVLGTVVPPLTAPLAGNDAFQQGWLQVAGGLNPVINSLLVQGGSFATQLLGSVTALDTLTLPGLESLDASLLDLEPVIAILPLTH